MCNLDIQDTQKHVWMELRSRHFLCKGSQAGAILEQALLLDCLGFQEGELGNACVGRAEI